MTFKFRWILVAAVVGYILGLLTCFLFDRQPAPQPDPLEPEVIEQLEDEGFTPPTGDAPVIPEAPEGVEPIATIGGGVEFIPRPPRPANPEGAGGTEPGPATVSSVPVQPAPSLPDVGVEMVPEMAPTDLVIMAPPLSYEEAWDEALLADACAKMITPGDLGGDCQAEIIAAGPEAMARLYWTGRLRLPTDQVLARGPEVVRETQFDWHAPEPLHVAPRSLISVSVGLALSDLDTFDTVTIQRPGHDREISAVTGEDTDLDIEWDVGYSHRSWAWAGKRTESRIGLYLGAREADRDRQWRAGVRWAGGVGSR